MKKNPNFYHENILQRIEELRVLKVQQKTTISMQYAEIISSLNPETIIKDTFLYLVNSKKTQKNIVHIVAKSGVNYIIEKFLGSNNSIKRYVSSIIAEKVSNSFLGSIISKL